jgi:hypothetical protein
VPVDAVISGVELAAYEPFGEGQVPFQGLLPGPEPVKELLGLGGPELLGVFEGGGVDLLVFRERTDAGLPGELLGRLEDAVFF